MRYPALAVSALVLLCSGCTSGLFETRQPVQQTYVITAGAPQPGAGAAVAVHLVVGRPIVGPGLFTDRIAVLHADRRLDYFSGNRWGATTDVMVQSLLVESLRATGRLSSVQSDLSAFTAQYLLQTELRDFQAEYADDAAAPVVRVRLVCTLGRVRAREPLAEYTVAAEARAQSNTMRAVIQAFEAAYREAAQSLVDHTLSGLAQAEAARSSP